MKNNVRLLSLDALRGFDMFFIMGGGSLVLAISAFLPDGIGVMVAEQMGHKAWHGLAFYDLIFPLFLFLAGVSFPFSLAKQYSLGRGKENILRKVLKRGITLVLLGMLYNGLLQFDFGDMRYASVLGRIGLAWMFAAMIYILVGRRLSAVISSAILLGYWMLLALTQVPDAPVGSSSFSMEGSVVGYIDRLFLPGRLHLGIHDPEGLLSTLPAIVTALVGIITGEYVRSSSSTGYRKCSVMLVAALLLLQVGYIWDCVFPINKNLWTSSFVCCAAGWSLFLFALFYFIIDVLGWSGWSFFFRVIGMNSITIYLSQQFLDFYKPVEALFGGLLGLVPEEFYALSYWGCYVIVCWGLLYFLYRNRIFLKV